MIIKYLWNQCESKQWNNIKQTKCSECKFNSILELDKCMTKLLDSDMHDNLEKYNNFYNFKKNHNEN